MDTELESGIVLPGDHPFRKFREGCLAKPELIKEMETAMAAVIQKVDPSDQGNRFVTGSAYEWIVAVAGWVVGIEAVPGGHSEKGFDLLSYRDELRGLWSIKSQTNTSKSAFRLTNTMGDSSKSNFMHATVFISPALPGLVYLDPRLAPDHAAKTSRTKDAVTISHATILNFAQANPNCVLPLSAPSRSKDHAGFEDPYLDFVSRILTSGTYSNLGPVMTRLRENAHTIRHLRAKLDGGVISRELFQKLLPYI